MVSDQYGQELKIGDKIVCSRGNLYKATILDIRPYRRYGTSGHKLIIEYLEPDGRIGVGEVSNAKSAIKVSSF